ncbi:MAG: T9SS type A sorting domain-containing protein [Flavobacteriales bacterium]|nr:T9SS type A sorting domain-containing protein [Flavobacteriales bacterium]
MGGLLDRVTNVQLMNGLGQVVWQEAGPVNDGGRVWVDAGVLPPGVYLVSVETTRTKHVERLVIEF